MFRILPEVELYFSNGDRLYYKLGPEHPAHSLYREQERIFCLCSGDILPDAIHVNAARHNAMQVARPGMQDLVQLLVGYY